MKTPRALFLLGIGLFTVLRFLLPSEIPFVNDQALLIERALAENARGGFTVAGLMGSRGLDYGPFAIWFYRAALLLSQDLVVVALLKMAFFYFLTIGGVVWICRNLKVTWEFPVFFVLLSPYLWIYSRDLWDNSFVIPLSAVFFASYLDFTLTKRFTSLLMAAIFVSFGFLTHLVFTPVVLAFAVHLMLFETSYWRKSLLKVVAAASVSFAIVLPYLLHAFKQRPTHQLEFGNLGHLVMPFTGARFFTSLGLEYYLGEGWYSPLENPALSGTWFFLIAFSALGYLFFLVGLFQMSRRVLLDRVSGDPFSKFSEIALLSFSFQLLLSFAYRLIPIPNFHSAQWVVICFAILLGLSLAKETLAGRKVIAVYCASLALGIPVFMAIIHVHGGSRIIHFGPTLGNQKVVASGLAKLEPQVLSREVFHVSKFPFAMDILTKLEEDEKAKRRVATARILYSHPEDEKDGRIELRIVD